MKRAINKIHDCKLMRLTTASKCNIERRKEREREGELVLQTSATPFSLSLCNQPCHCLLFPDSRHFLLRTRNEWSLPCSGYSSITA